MRYPVDTIWWSVLGTAAVLASGCSSALHRDAPDLAGASLHEQYSKEQAREAAGRRGPIELTEPSQLSDYLAYAALNNPGLEAAFSKWQASLERAPQVRSLPDPHFTYRYYIREVETRVGPQRQSFGLSQTFPWFGELRLRGDVAAEEANADRRRYEARKLALFYRVKDAYYEHYYLGRAIAIVRENRDLLTYLERVARTRYKAAAAGHPDVIRAQVELGTLEDRARTLEALRGPIVARLNAALDRPPHAPLPWPESAPLETVAATDEEILAWLRESSPELRAMSHEIAARRHALNLAKKDAYPDVTLTMDYVDTRDAVLAGTPDGGKDPVTVGVSINLPIWAHKTAAAVREARARHWAALKDKAERAGTLSSEVKLALYHLRDAERKVDLYRDTLLPKGRESLKATEGAFRTGKATFTDLVDAQRVLLEFELAHERALASHAQRLAEVEMLVGRELPRAAAGEIQEGGEQ